MNNADFIYKSGLFMPSMQKATSLCSDSAEARQVPGLVTPTDSTVPPSTDFISGSLL